MDKHVWRTGRNITNPKSLKNPDKKICPECKQRVRIFTDKSVEAHKVFEKGSRTKWSYCSWKKDETR